MPYSLTSFAQMVSALSVRLYDPLNQFWSTAELTQRIQDALRLWNLLTGWNTQWYALTVSSGNITPWYDLQTIAGSPRLATLQDTDVYSRLQYHLLESQLPNAGVLTGQFSTAALVTAVQNKRDEFLFRSSVTRSIEALNVTPNVSTVMLPQTVIEVQRGYWLPTGAGLGNPGPILRTDQFARSGYAPSAILSPSDPVAMGVGVEPMLTVALLPPPNINGQIELTTIESQAKLTAATPTTLLLPGDMVPALAWGALADLLGANGEAGDATRADYARMRFDQYIEAAAVTPFVMGATQVNGVDVMAASVESLDFYNPLWRVPQNVEPIVAFAGQNLICYPTTAASAQILLFLNGNANLTDPIQIGEEELDAVLDLAQHEAMFKQGSHEIQSSMSLFKNFVAVATKRNQKLAALSSFKQTLFKEMESSQHVNSPLEVA